MMKELERYFYSRVQIPLIRHEKTQRIETLLNEKDILLAKNLRDEK